jgi:hypothetical protein
LSGCVHPCSRSMPIPLGNQTWQREDLKVLIIYKLLFSIATNGMIVLWFQPASLASLPMFRSDGSHGNLLLLILTQNGNYNVYVLVSVCVCVCDIRSYTGILCGFDIVHRTKYILYIHYTCSCRLQTRAKIR